MLSDEEGRFAFKRRVNCGKARERFGEVGNCLDNRVGVRVGFGTKRLGRNTQFHAAADKFGRGEFCGNGFGKRDNGIAELDDESVVLFLEFGVDHVVLRYAHDCEFGLVIEEV